MNLILVIDFPRWPALDGELVYCGVSTAGSREAIQRAVDEGRRNLRQVMLPILQGVPLPPPTQKPEPEPKKKK